MAKKVVAKRRRRRRKVEDEVVAEEEQEDEVEEQEVEEKPKRRRRRRTRSKVKEAKDEDDVEEEEADEEPEEQEEAPKRQAKKVDSKPTKRSGRTDRVKSAEEMEADMEADANAEPEDKAPRLPRSVEVKMEEAFIVDVMQALEVGQNLIISRRNTGEWWLRKTTGTAIPLEIKSGDDVVKLRGNEYWNEVLNPEWKKWADEWNQLEWEERKAYAEENDIEWQDHDTEKIAKMNLGNAVREYLGIEKYKKQYRSAAARREIRA